MVLPSAGQARPSSFQRLVDSSFDIIPEGNGPEDALPFWIDTAVHSGDTPTIVGDNPTTTVEVVTSSNDPASPWFRNPLVERDTWSWKITA